MKWTFVLAVLTCNILFMSASYTMIIPFLPMYLTNELGVDETMVSLWAGLAFSAAFLVSAIMGPIWGRKTPHGNTRKSAALHQLFPRRHGNIT